MDGRRFDALARRLTKAATRRAAVGAALALAFGAAVADDAVAARSTCRRFGQSCTRGSQCCTGQCATGSKVPRASRNRCVCPTGEGLCNGACVDLTSDTNCGACGNVCDSETSCIEGTCQDCSDVAGYCASATNGRYLKAAWFANPSSGFGDKCSVDTECQVYDQCSQPGRLCFCLDDLFSNGGVIYEANGECSVAMPPGT
jgi:hypothetical protein